MYSRKKGKSGSKKPFKNETRTWVKYKAKEIELLVVKLFKEEKTTSEIGIILRDSYGIPDVKMKSGKTISQILKSKKLLPELPENLKKLLERILALQKHVDNNKQDQVAKRSITLTESKIKRLVKYYKRTGVLSEEWKYNPKRVNLLIK